MIYVRRCATCGSWIGWKLRFKTIQDFLYQWRSHGWRALWYDFSDTCRCDNCTDEDVRAVWGLDDDDEY